MIALAWQLLVAVALAWTVLSALLALFVRTWLRERWHTTVYPARHASGLLNPLRRLIQDPAKTVRAFRIHPGDTVLELGPGPGYFTVEAARAASEHGRVICVDLQPEMLHALRDRLHTHTVTNARPVAGDATRIPLRDASIDVAFLVAMLGEVPDRPAAIGELRRVIKPGGTLAFAETLTDPDYQVEPGLRDLCRAYGFKPVAREGIFLGYTIAFEAPPAGLRTA
jgi:SAM-dependent methyltransferase